MTMLERTQKKESKSKGIIALAAATLGTIGVVVYYAYGSRDLRGMDAAMLFVIIGFTAYGTTQNIIRGLLTGVSIYLATAIAGMFYHVLTPYARSFLNLLPKLGFKAYPAGNPDTSALAVSFAFAAVLLWVILEFLFRAALRDSHLAFLGPVDRIGGMLVYLVIGVLVAALLFNGIGYGVAGRDAHNRASLRPEFNQVMTLIYKTQSIWFPGRPPAIYAYDQSLRE